MTLFNQFKAAVVDTAKNTGDVLLTCAKTGGALTHSGGQYTTADSKKEWEACAARIANRKQARHGR